MNLEGDLFLRLRRNVLFYGVLMLIFWVVGMALDLWFVVYYRFGFLILSLVFIHTSARNYSGDSSKDGPLIFLILSLIILLASLFMVLSIM